MTVVLGSGVLVRCGCEAAMDPSCIPLGRSRRWEALAVWSSALSCDVAGGGRVLVPRGHATPCCAVCALDGFLFCFFLVSPLALANRPPIRARLFTNKQVPGPTPAVCSPRA